METRVPRIHYYLKRKDYSLRPNGRKMYFEIFHDTVIYRLDKMKDQNKTKTQLIEELTDLRERIGQLEKTQDEKNRLEELLQKERETFFPVLHKAPYGVALIDKDGKFIYINPEFTNITGYKMEDLLFGRSWFNKAYVFPEYRLEIIRSWKNEIIQKGIEKVFSIICKDEEIKEVEFKPALLGDGRIIVMLSDITERKRTEQALQESETRYRTLFEESREATYIMSREGKLIDFNQALLDLLGYNREEMMMMCAQQTCVNLTDWFRFQQELEQKGTTKDFDVKLQRKDGKIIDCLITSTVQMGKGERMIEYQGIIRDITQQKQTEEQLKYLSTHDSLTGLYNRTYFEEETVRLERGRHFPVSVLMVDVDGLKVTNDTLGHAAGDELLKQVANLLKLSFREEDVVARIGGDEFAVLLPNADVLILKEVLTRIGSKIVRHNAVSNRPSISLSLGVGTCEKGERLIEVLKEADVSMYRNKLEKKSEL